MTLFICINVELVVIVLHLKHEIMMVWNNMIIQKHIIDFGNYNLFLDFNISYLIFISIIKINLYIYMQAWMLYLQSKEVNN
jgi:hypothetical protein